MSDDGLLDRLLDRWDGDDEGRGKLELPDAKASDRQLVEPEWKRSAMQVIEMEQSKALKVLVFRGTSAVTFSCLTVAVPWFVLEKVNAWGATLAFCALLASALRAWAKTVGKWNRLGEGSRLKQQFFQSYFENEIMRLGDPLWRHYQRYESRG